MIDCSLTRPMTTPAATMTTGAPRFHRSSRDAAKERTAMAIAIMRSSEFM